jgi:hypothetical protein
MQYKSGKFKRKMQNYNENAKGKCIIIRQNENAT